MGSRKLEKELVGPLDHPQELKGEIKEDKDLAEKVRCICLCC